MARKKGNVHRKAKYAAYRSEKKGIKNKVNRLYNKIKNYRNPMNFVNGLKKSNEDLYERLNRKFKK